MTAQQLNRVAASVVDAAIQAKKEDVTRLVGRDGVAGAWEIIENSDVVIILNQEIKADTGELFMTFKLLKRRYRSSETSEKLRKLDYFNHPYNPENSIQLLDDLEEPQSLSLTSLATQFIGAEDVSKRGKRNVTEREEKVLRLRFGLLDGRTRTLEEVGKEFNVTRERIRQIEAKALRKLKNPNRCKRLRDFVK